MELFVKSLLRNSSSCPLGTFYFLPHYRFACNILSCLTNSSKASVLWARYLINLLGSIGTQSSAHISPLPLFALFVYRRTVSVLYMDGGHRASLRAFFILCSSHLAPSQSTSNFQRNIKPVRLRAGSLP